MKTSFIGITLWSLSALLPLSAATPASPLPPDLEPFIEQGLKDWRLPGLAIAVVHKGEVVLQKGYGVREVGKPDKIDADTVFAIGSTSKAFTSAAIGTLVDAGKLRWDTPVAKLWPEFRLSDEWVTREIRVSDLLANHSGLNAVSEALWYGTGYDRAEILRRLAAVPIDEGFRYQFQYRNTMFLAAGELIPHVDGRSWDDYIAEVFFKPLGMTRTYASEVTMQAVENVAQPHLIDYEGAPLVVPYRKMHNIGPAGSIFSSVRDMTPWLDLYLGKGTVAGHEYLKPHTVAMLHRSQTPLSTAGPAGQSLGTPVELPAYALAWVTESYRGVRVVWHNGGIDGMSAWVGLIPEKQTGVVILSNLDECDLRRAVFYKIVDHLIGGAPVEQETALVAKQHAALAARDEAEKRWTALAAKSEPLALPITAYVGSYRHPALGEVQVGAQEKEHLFVIRNADRNLVLAAEGGNRFLGKPTNPLEDLRTGKVAVEFEVKDGVVEALVEDGAIRYERVR